MEAPESAPPVLNVTSSRQLASPRPLKACRYRSPGFALLIVSCAEFWISTMVLNETFQVLVALAALARPPVSPSMLDVPATLVTSVLVAPTLMDCAVTCALLSIAAVTFEVISLTTTAPAPDSRPTATAVTLVRAAEVCWAETTTAPGELITALVPIAAVVLALVVVFGAAASPATTPPLPASASAALSSA